MAKKLVIFSFSPSASPLLCFILRMAAIGLDSTFTFPNGPVQTPYSIGGTDIKTGQNYVIAQSACIEGCENLGAQQILISLDSELNLRTIADPIVSTYSTQFYGVEILYTLGQKQFSVSSTGSGSHITVATSVDIELRDALGATGTVKMINNGLLVGTTASYAPVRSANAAVGISYTIPVASLTSTGLGDSSSDAGTSDLSTSTATGPSGISRPSPPSSDSISAGAVAGVAIGCIIAGILIGALVMFLLRRRKRNQRLNPPMELNPLGPNSKEPYVEVNSAGSSLVATVMSNLPQATEDKEIKRKMEALGQRISSHVASYYNTTTPDITPDVSDISKLGPEMAISTAELSHLLSNRNTRAEALSLVIAWTIISRLDMSYDSNMSFLPVEASTILSQVRGAIVDGDQAQTSLFSLWRTLTASLIQSKHTSSRTYSLSSPLASPTVPAASIRSALDALEIVLAPYVADKTKNSERKKNLEEVMKRGARFGFLVFSQPGTLEFRWRDVAGTVGGTSGVDVTVYPALVQTVGDDGDRLTRERVLVEGEGMRR